jgi:hypothetical protein
VRTRSFFKILIACLAGRQVIECMNHTVITNEIAAIGQGINFFKTSLIPWNKKFVLTGKLRQQRITGGRDGARSDAQ